MGCPGCPDNSKEIPDVDKRGNVVGKKTGLFNPSETKGISPRMIPTHPMLESLTYEEYIVQKTIFRKQSEAFSNKAVKEFSNDYKRIQIQELIDVVNHDDAGPLSPSQAIKALKSLSTMSAYVEVFKEFKGLNERLEELYSKLIEGNKIKVEWKR